MVCPAQAHSLHWLQDCRRLTPRTYIIMHLFSWLNFVRCANCTVRCWAYECLQLSCDPLCTMQFDHQRTPSPLLRRYSQQPALVKKGSEEYLPCCLDTFNIRSRSLRVHHLHSGMAYSDKHTKVTNSAQVGSHRSIFLSTKLQLHIFCLITV